MPEHLATCSCESLAVRAQGEPVRVSVCHCLACQKRTGSVFGAQARFLADAVTTEVQSTEYLRIGDEGGTDRFHFCPKCGSTVSTCWTRLPTWLQSPLQNWLILKNASTVVGLFQRMFERNILTFNTGWDSGGKQLPVFTDIRDLQRELRAQGVRLISEADEATPGPGSFMAEDPDGNQILVVQHV